MGKLAILKISDGDFEQGFPVTLRVGEDGVFPDTEMNGRLPPAPMIPEQYECWQSTYRDRGIGSGRSLEALQGQTTNSSIEDSAAQLQEGINDWLNSGNRGFQRIRDRLVGTLSQNNDDIRFIIQADDVRLWRLPWHLWDILERCDNVEVALSLPEIKPIKLPKTPQDQVRILVILGESPDINVQNDLELLQQRLPDAYINTIKNPQRDQLSDELWKQNWDILFFAGHSSSDGGEGEGRFYISQTESLTIVELKYALRNAIDHGLKLTIFNSCDGLGLARNLASLGMPAIIVMRERVPDRAAQKFLDYFLEAFAQRRKPLYASVREARDRLHILENEYPCASWLPVMCQNPAAVPLTWQGLRGRRWLPALQAAIALSSLLGVVLLLFAWWSSNQPSESPEWVQPPTLPPVVKGDKEPGPDLYVCRASYKGGLYPGKILRDASSCNIVYEWQEISLSNYEVLTGARDFKWQTPINGQLPPNAFKGGKDQGHDAYVCQAA